MQVQIDRQPYRVRVFRNGQLVSADEPIGGRCESLREPPRGASSTFL